jgi:Flp pilus assembly protein TadD
VELITQAIALCPQACEYYVNLGTVYDDMGRLEDAIAAYQKAVAVKADYPVALSNLGNTLRRRGRTGEAIAACRRALAIQPNHAQAHNHLGAALTQSDPDEAVAHLSRAVALQPAFAEAHSNLGAALLQKGMPDEAVAACRRAVSLQPQNPEAHLNLGNAWAATASIDQAALCFRQALALSPTLALAHWSLGVMLLLQGDFQNGWAEYEWRLRVPEFARRTPSSKPLWDGADLAGRRIVLAAEQGIGDVIHFIRYLPLVAARGGKIIVSCPRELHRLLKPMAPVEQWVAPDEPWPEHDLQCPLLSLPRLMGTTVATIPAPIPYLHADPALVEQWQARLPKEPRLRVGLAWAGRAAHRNDRNRSIPPALLAPLADVNGLLFCSLQKDSATLPPLPQLADWTADLHDFADTAALLENLDLVITADTAVAHLAGALGRKVWVLLPFLPDWRWMLRREDSPWYPTMRLFRQPRPGDWSEPIERIVQALRQL